MGKSLIQQKRGKGSPRYRAPSFRYAGKVEYPSISENMKAEIIDLVHSQGHSAPLMELKFTNGMEGLLQAPEGTKVGSLIEFGSNIDIKDGNIMQLKYIPVGISIFNVESTPGDGGKFVRTAGGTAKIVSKSEEGAIVLLPSGKKRLFHLKCRATIGIIAGAGRKEKPFLKAGAKYYAMIAKNKVWPSVSGTSMNSVNHPFGGRSSHAKGIPTQSSRNAPPGRKVGKIAPKKTGRGKK